MNITYRTKDYKDVVLSTTAHCQIPMYGRWVDLQVTAYSSNGGTAINFTAKPLTDELRAKKTFDGTTNDRQLRIDIDRDSGRQSITQNITFPQICGVILHWSELNNGGVDCGRTVARAILEKTKSMVETIRIGIRQHVAKTRRQQILDILGDRYTTITEGVVKQFLGEINWRMMLRGANCEADTLNVIEASLDGRNASSFHAITFDGDTGVELIANTERFSFSRLDVASMKATGMLRKVCGDELGDEFNLTGAITFSHNEYIFKMRANQFIDCTDPNGKHARLCIHTLAFQVNAIDELSFAYLNIKNNFDEYMSTAIYHGPQKGFVKPLLV